MKNEPNVTIYYNPGEGWHWQLNMFTGRMLNSSSESFATANEAERVARSVARCNGAAYHGIKGANRF